KVLPAGRGIALGQPGTAAGDCNIADVSSISQIYNVTLELKPYKEEKDEVYSVTPCLRQYPC
ncbi:hypothetical protein, partial [Parasediminibacterium sp. JCM 36343]|uniref:hypothetical protein n=1 Tax=Parasediminibacterium sp. JCM 36343 TaxID=3374279 RepID=UPI00397D26D3